MHLPISASYDKWFCSVGVTTHWHHFLCVNSVNYVHQIFGTKIHLISLLMSTEFEGNPIKSICRFFLQVCEKKKKWATFWEGSYLRKGWHDLSPDILLLFFTCFTVICQQYINTKLKNKVQFYAHLLLPPWFLAQTRPNFLCRCLTMCAHASFSWAARYTTMCLDYSHMAILIKYDWWVTYFLSITQWIIMYSKFSHQVSLLKYIYWKWPTTNIRYWCTYLTVQSNTSKLWWIFQFPY